MSTPNHERAFDPRRVQQALVCMLFDPKYAARVYGEAELAELGVRERALLREVDPRALATDDMRRARAMHAILDEFPVSAAVVGLDLVDRFFASPAFRRCVFERGAMALAFGDDYLRDRAKGVGALETAMAHARRRRPRTGPPASLARAPGVEIVRVPDQTLAWYQRGRQRLGDEPLRALAKLRKPWKQKPPRRGAQWLLIETDGDGSLALGGASAALGGLLAAAGQGIAPALLRARAIELGAAPEDAAELLDDLVRDGLLVDLG